MQDGECARLDGFWKCFESVAVDHVGATVFEDSFLESQVPERPTVVRFCFGGKFVRESFGTADAVSWKSEFVCEEEGFEDLNGVAVDDFL